FIVASKETTNKLIPAKDTQVRELEARLAILEQGVTEQKDFNTKSIEDKEIGDFILEEPADVSDSVIAQPKQCKPPQIEEVTTK
ncbi:15377_t:CDS:2, partial [Funneliformis geosporum]